MRRLTSLTIFFPTYRDAPVLPAMVEKAFEVASLCAAEFEVVPVNDGSPDETPHLLLALQERFGSRLRPVTHAVNRGYGAAVKSGFQSARMDYVFYTDGDGQYDLDDLPKLVAEMSDDVGLVNGYKIRRSDSLLRQILGSLYLFTVRHAFWLKIHDVDCDFRLVRSSVMRQVHLVSDSGAICVELVRKIQNTGCGIREVPVRHLPRTHGVSQFFRLGNLWRMIRDDARMFWTLMVLRQARPARSRTASEEACAHD